MMILKLQLKPIKPWHGFYGRKWRFAEFMYKMVHDSILAMEKRVLIDAEIRKCEGALKALQLKRLSANNNGAACDNNSHNTTGSCSTGPDGLNSLNEEGPKGLSSLHSTLRPQVE